MKNIRTLRRYNDAKLYLLEIETISEYESVKKGTGLPIYSCPVCSENQFAKTEQGYYCFSCQNKYSKKDICFCDICGKVLVKSIISRCDECIENM